MSAREVATSGAIEAVRRSPSTDAIVTALGWYALIGGAISLLGWAADIPRLTDWGSTGISIQPNTTAAAMLAGGSLVLLQSKRCVAAAFVGMLVAMVGASTAFQYLSGINLDAVNTSLMFGRAWGQGSVVYPGRMGPPSTICWTLIGLALACAATPIGSRWRRYVPGLALFTFAVSALSITGYVYGADRLYSLPYLTVIAFQTASFIVALSIGLIANVNERPPALWIHHTGATGRVARRAVPFIIIVPLMAGALQLAGQGLGLYDMRFGVAILVFAVTIVLIVAWSWSLSALARDERALRQTQQRLSDTLESITNAFVTIDRDWRFQYVNDTAERVLGRPRSELIGREVWRLFPESPSSIAYRELTRAFKDRVTVEFEELNPLMERWFANRAYPTRDGGLAVYFEDVTERKRIEQQIAADLAATSRLQSLSTKLVQSGDMQPLLQEILAAAAELTGTDKGNIQFFDPKTGRLRIIVHQGHGPPFLEHFANDGSADGCGAAAVLRTRHIVEDVDVGFHGKDHAILRGDGIRATQSTPLISRDGRLVGMLNNHYPVPHRPSDVELRYLDLLARMAADFVERTRAEQALHDSDRRKDEFLATLAHELRGPLAPVVNSLELLKHAGSETPMGLKARDTMHRQLSHMVRLIDDLLDVSRISRDKLQLRVDRMELRPIMEQAAESCAHHNGSSPRLTMAIPETPVFLDADAARLVQVFGNLIGNACKFTPADGRIAVIADVQGSELVVRVSDTGIGMPPEKLDTVFRIFGQLDAPQDHKYGGLGIGLYLVKRLVEMHGGTVSAHSDGPGQGSEFVVRLPVASVTPAPLPPPSRVGAASTPVT